MAFWRLHKHEVHGSSHSVVSLDMHLEGQESIFFRRTVDDARTAFEANKDTQLTAYFKLVGQDSNARNITYVQMPELYTWIRSDRVWRKRQRQLCVGRVFNVSPSAGRRAFLPQIATFHCRWRRLFRGATHGRKPRVCNV